MSRLYTIFGLDIGWTHDFTSLVGIHSFRAEPESDDEQPYVRHGMCCVERFPHSMGPKKVADKVPEIIADTKRAIFDFAERQENTGPMSTFLAVDASNDRSFVGHLPPTRQLGARLRKIVITSGNTETLDPEESKVSRTRLVSNLRTATGFGRIHTLMELSEGEQLKREIARLQRHETRAGNLVYQTEPGEHDDLVIALAMAVWLGDRIVRYRPPRRTAFSNIAGTR